MSPTELLTVGAVTLVGLAILGAALYIASVGIGRIRIARALREARPTALGEIPSASGLLTFEGTARAGSADPLEAPLSGTECLAYTVSSRSRYQVNDGSAPSDLEGENDGAVSSTEPQPTAETEPAAETATETPAKSESPTETAAGSADEAAWSFDGQVSASGPFTVDDGFDYVAVDPTNAVLSLDDWETPQTAWMDRTDLEGDTLARLEAAGLPGVEDDDGRKGSSESRRQYREHRLEAGTEVRVFGGRVADSRGSTDGTAATPTVTGDDWFEIAVGEESTVAHDRRRSGSLYLLFGGLIAIPGVGFTLAGIVGLVTTLVF